MNVSKILFKPYDPLYWVPLNAYPRVVFLGQEVRGNSPTGHSTIRELGYLHVNLPAVYSLPYICLKLDLR